MCCGVGVCVTFSQLPLLPNPFAYIQLDANMHFRACPCSPRHMPCQTDRVWIDAFRLLPMAFFARFFGTCVGQASNPGPGKLRLAIVNPTAVLKKVGDLLELGANIIVAAETSETELTQKQVTQSFLQKKFRCFWSPPVQSQFDTQDSRPSFRGEALGTAIFTSIPARRARVDVPIALTNSCRFCCNVIQIKQRDVLVVSLYGFPGATRVQHGKRMNNILLTCVLEVVQRTGLPFIIAGDFNEPPTSLPIFSEFSAMGAVEIHTWYFQKFGRKLPPTCRGATFNDTAVIHPWIAEHISEVSVNDSSRIGDHSPLLIDFDVTVEADLGFVWSLPQCWAPFAPPKDMIEQSFLNSSMKFPDVPITDATSGMNALLNWSQHVEHSIDKAIQTQHHNNPTIFPWNGLPSKFRGRCQEPQQIPVVPPKSVGGDRRDGYIPPYEIFSVQSKLKTRQVRRLTSLRRALKSTRLDDERKGQLLQIEWDCIRRAKGYGKSWERWALGFEALPFVPKILPDVDYLDLAIAITKIDCDFACHHEFEKRQKSFRFRMQLDQTEDFSRLTFKPIREPPAATIQEVPAEHRCHASLCRLQKGIKTLRVLDRPFPDFTLRAEANFGAAKILILQQDQDVITFELTEGFLPSNAMLVQSFTATSNSQLFKEFHKYWSPFWLRDPYESQFDDRHCADFLEELQSIPLPDFPNIHIDLAKVELWQTAIDGLKAGKAHGSCGWRHEELKCLPTSCIEKLAGIFAQIVNFSFSGFLMHARTILLPKNDSPNSMSQIRPITIISALFRLLGKVIFRVVADQWSAILPWNISGGLPRRGVKELSFRQKLAIEDAISQKLQLGGFSLDLIKAFNTFDRRILRYAMLRLGIPPIIVQFWFQSLSNLQRFPQVNGCLGPAIDSTTGVPEGDSLSVLAMISLSTLFYYKLKSIDPVITPFCYADNWAWSAGAKHAHFKAFTAMLNLVMALRVTIDFNKSWFWALKKDFRQTCSDLLLLFPSGDIDIQIKSHVKDLGEVVNYTRKAPLDFIKSRIDQAVSRIHRLRHIPSSVQCKLHKIQAACWPLALYAAESNYVGQVHFQDLRKAVVTAVLGKRKFANARLAVFALSKFICDPLLYVVNNIVRIVKKMHDAEPQLIVNFLRLANDFSGSRPFSGSSVMLCQIFEPSRMASFLRWRD